MSAIIFNNNVLSSIMIIIGFLLVFLFYRNNIQVVFYIKPKENKLSKLSKFLHRYYNLFFIILFSYIFNFFFYYIFLSF
ncbi:hypothetical protein [Brachyspira pulli]|uniref:hypothetical protein n=1 Tax=Brachyspira pulli TaxID=310721 RepID=UPI0030054277